MYDELVKELRDSAEWADRLAVLMGRAEGDTHAPIMRKAADAIEKLSAHYCPHMIRNVHDRGDDSLCRVLGAEPPKEES